MPFLFYLLKKLLKFVHESKEIWQTTDYFLTHVALEVSIFDSWNVTKSIPRQKQIVLPNLNVQGWTKHPRFQNAVSMDVWQVSTWLTDWRQDFLNRARDLSKLSIFCQRPIPLKNGIVKKELTSQYSYQQIITTFLDSQNITSTKSQSCRYLHATHIYINEEA